MEHYNQGIYTITCEENGIIYVGQSKNIKKRWKEHINSLQNNTHPNEQLTKDYKEYGRDSFKFEILESYSVYNLQLNLFREKFVVDYFNNKDIKTYNSFENYPVSHTMDIFYTILDDEFIIVTKRPDIFYSLFAKEEMMKAISIYEYYKNRVYELKNKWEELTPFMMECNMTIEKIYKAEEIKKEVVKIRMEYGREINKIKYFLKKVHMQTPKLHESIYFNIFKDYIEIICDADNRNKYIFHLLIDKE